MILFSRVFPLKTCLNVWTAAAISILIAPTLIAGGQAPKPSAAANEPAPAFELPKPRHDFPAPPRPRVIVTTDGEIDDRCSMIRFLLYSNDFDTEALIYSSSMFHWLGHTWSGVEWIHAQIEMYSRIYPSLNENADGYPTPDELRSKVYVGNIANVGEMETDSPGSDKIMEVLLDDKPGPVYLATWGGTNTVARALYKIQHEHPDQVDKVSKKAVLYIILDQDKTFRQYIEPNWPKLQVLGSFSQFGVFAYMWEPLMPESMRVFFRRPWMEGNITSNHGSLAGAYESFRGAFRSEGDSPSFISLIPTGLRSLETPSNGGWGGRFEPEKPGTTNVWKNVGDDNDLFKPIWRWADAIQNDFAARVAWSTKPYNQANHAPIVNVDGPLDLSVSAGQTVRLSIEGSTDPDGDRLDFHWWQYRDAGTYKGAVSIENGDRDSAGIHIPPDGRAGDTIHIIAQVTDEGKPPITRYARFILTVSGPRPAQNPDHKKGGK